MPLRKVGIVGTGSYIPEDRITNADLEKIVDTNNEWIVSRTGILERRRARPDQASSDLGSGAAFKALEAAGLTPDQIDAIIVASITPDMNFPSTACWIQKKLKALNASAHDLSAACSGFIYALRSGRALIASGEADTVLVVGAETLTKYTDYEDRASCILFGDGAGAVVLRPTDGPRQIVEIFARADGYSDAAQSMILKCGGSQSPFCQRALDNKEHLMFVKGREVYKFAVTKFYELIVDAAARLGVAPTRIDWLIPHQVNQRIVEGAAERLNFPIERIFMNIHRYGNTSSASIPIALDEAVRGGHIKDGQLLVFVAFGAGLTWASAAVRW